MNDPAIHEVVAALERLATTAPPSLAPRVLAELELADRYFAVEGPLGPALVSFSTRGVTGCVPGTDPAVLEERLGRPVVVTDEVPARLRTAVDRTLRTGKTGPLPLDLRAIGEFRRAVLEKTAEIPPGEVRPYGWLAREIGRPGAVRAVGTALAKNPIPWLIPCHRVVRSDYRIGQYAFGAEMKRSYLAEEGLDPDTLDELHARRVRFVGSDTTHIYCNPTCRHARRITPAHRMEFRSSGEAETAGYRPCKVCRPVAA